MSCEIDTPLRRPLTGLAKTVKPVDCLGSRRKVDRAKRAGRVPHADFSDTGSDRRHRLPVSGFETALDAKQRVARLSMAAAGSAFRSALELPTQTTDFISKAYRIAAAYARYRITGDLGFRDVELRRNSSEFELSWQARRLRHDEYRRALAVFVARLAGGASSPTTGV